MGYPIELIFINILLNKVFEREDEVSRNICCPPKSFISGSAHKKHFVAVLY